MQRRLQEQLHLNILEFVGVIINVWLAIHFAKQDGHKAGGHIIQILADNTSALSWMHYAARCHSRPVRHISSTFYSRARERLLFYRFLDVISRES
jgi:hypothetical protein